MSNIVKASDISNVLATAKKNGVKEITIKVPAGERVTTTDFNILGFKGTITQTTTAYQSITFKC